MERVKGIEAGSLDDVEVLLLYRHTPGALNRSFERIADVDPTTDEMIDRRAVCRVGGPADDGQNQNEANDQQAMLTA